MKQVLQDLKSGETRVAEVPVPMLAPGSLLIATRRTLLSAGTERMLVEFGRANLLQKARQQPERVRMTLEKVKTDGLLTTIDAVRSKLDQPLPLGYCNAGVVIGVGRGVEDFTIGDRVVSNGPHAEVVRVPKTLVARIPDAVADDHAPFAILGAIALQGQRLAQPTLGECFVVIGLGLIGLLSVQLLRANGCRVLGIDPNRDRLEVAQHFGAETVDPSREDVLARALSFSRARGVDGVLVTAATTSNEPMRQAAQMCRTRGRIVLVGVAGLELNRDDFYRKEISFQVSCSYGPGRYDPAFEEQGHDYPLGFVRWTEQRNFEAVLDMIASGSLAVDSLITHRFPIARAADAYQALLAEPGALGILLNYDEPVDAGRGRSVALAPAPAAALAAAGAAVVGFIGAGNFASRVLMPAFRQAGARLRTVVSATGVAAAYHGRKLGFETAATDAAAVLADPAIDTVVVASRHDSHAAYAIEAIRAGKNVFVEKPLALTEEELDAIERAHGAARDAGRPVRIMVGFNRRFAPHTVEMRRLLAQRSEPKCFIVTVNAGDVPADHWTQDPAIGGGRIIGEACHFIDLMRHLAGSPLTQVSAQMIGPSPGLKVRSDKAVITLGFADGSLGTIHYLANGGKAFPKERIEVFCGGGVLQIDNFLRLRSYSWPGARALRLWRQDKGHAAGAAAFVAAVRQGAASPIPFDEIIEVSRATIRAARLLADGDRG
jgi:predicted dehydrogenase